jgi:hypothetical protein
MSVLFAAIVTAVRPPVAGAVRDCFSGARRPFPDTRAGLPDRPSALHKQSGVITFFLRKIAILNGLRRVGVKISHIAADLSRRMRMSW